jgi:hypothetical protein
MHSQCNHANRRAGAFDASVHISEEVLNANVAIPYAIILATTSSSILGLGKMFCRCMALPLIELSTRR